MTIHRERTGGSGRYWVVFFAVLGFVVVALATNYFGLNPW